MSAILLETAPRGTAAEIGAFSDRLAAADRALQMEKGMLVLLRSWRWLVPWLLGSMLADVLLHLGAPVRLFLSLSFVALVVGTGVAAAWIALVRRNAPEHTARVLESRDARLGSKLINILQLRAQADDPQLAPLTRKLATCAVAGSAAEIAPIDLQRLTSTDRLEREAKRLGIALVALLAVLAIGHEITRAEVPRFLDAFGDHPPFSFTRIAITEPANDGLPVIYGQHATIAAQTRGHRPHDLFLTFHPPGEPAKATTVPMFDKGEKGFAQQIDGVKTDLVVVAHTKNRHSISAQRRVAVVLTPRLEKATVKTTWPDYTGIPPEERPLPLGKSIKALAGSRIEFRLESNRPLREGRVELVKGPGLAKPFALAQQGERAVTGAIEASEPGLLRFALVDESGNPSSDSWECSLQVTHDLPPEVRVSNPSSDAFVAADFKIEPVFEADDDYGVKTMRIHQSLNGKNFEPRVVNYDRITRNARETVALDLAKLDLKSGDTIAFFAEAIDTSPEEHFGRSQNVTFTIISVEEYNDFLRERMDLDDISAKYSELLDEWRESIESQKNLGNEIGALKEQPNAQKLDDLLAKQSELNSRLNKLAEKMDSFVRKNPLYDIEQELQKTLSEKAREIRDSTKSNDAAGKDVAQRSAPPNAQRQVDQPMLDDFKKASDEQLAKLGAAEQQARESVERPLEDMALMNEILKDINRFKELDAAQKQVAAQAKAYHKPSPLSREDQLALKDLAAMEKAIGEQLDAVQKQLGEDGKAAMEKFPKAGESAQKLAEKMAGLRLPGYAGRATDAMLAGRGDQGAQIAQQLSEEMGKMFSECNGACPNMNNELDGYLSIQRGMKPGNNFKQMMQSRKFGTGNKTGFGIGQGETGPDGTDGFAVSAMPESSVLGNESRPTDQRAKRAGDKGNNKQAPQPDKEANAIGDTDTLKNVKPNNAESNAAQGEQSLEEYRDLVERYFRAITK